uniref:Uncharacterized protein n=1 Tax=Meloidogyne hapla TaxID=6305 RepID=A0A1I8B7D4_MELHA
MATKEKAISIRKVFFYKSLRTCLFEFFRDSSLDVDDSSFNVLSESIVEAELCEERLEFCAISTGTDESVRTEEEPTPVEWTENYFQSPRWDFGHLGAISPK